MFQVSYSMSINNRRCLFIQHRVYCCRKSHVCTKNTVTLFYTCQLHGKVKCRDSCGKTNGAFTANLFGGNSFNFVDVILLRLLQLFSVLSSSSVLRKSSSLSFSPPRKLCTKIKRGSTAKKRNRVFHLRVSMAIRRLP